MTHKPTALQQSLTERYKNVPALPSESNPALELMAARGSCRQFLNKPVNDALIDMLCAVALASPTKSDLQQRDILIVKDSNLRNKIEALLGKDSWTADAPVMLVFLGNNRRQRQLSEWSVKPFPNDHLDAFFNAAVDAGIAMSAFVTAAETVELGCCPISQIRNHCEAISTLLHLPDHVFLIAGLAIGWPAQPPEISPRLPLSVTVHHNQFSEAAVKPEVEAYDLYRNTRQPYAQQRNVAQFGTSGTYGWSEDKARQYAQPQRTDFGSFIRNKGFILD